MKKHSFLHNLMRALPLLGGMGWGVCSLTACSSEPPRPEDVAMQTAKTYYEQLLQGDYEAYVEGALQGEKTPEDYRKQLILNMQMFIEEQIKAHGGIDSVAALRATVDTIPAKGSIPESRVANVFLAICYADSAKEEIVVPMIEKDNLWYLR